MITIVDYGMGNLGSIANMFKRIGQRSVVSSDPSVISDASKVVLPGVGAFDTAMQRIHEAGLRNVLDRKALVERVPILGICLGMQLMTRGSEEGALRGLGWISATTRRFPSDGPLKVPHIGWNRVKPVNESPLTSGFSTDARFYFVHSYYVLADSTADSILRTEYGVVFDAAIGHKNFYAVQFHPEKSHRFGKRLLGNFVAI